MNCDHAVEQLERFVMRSLERVAADDRAVAAATMDASHLSKHRRIITRRTAREDHEAPTIERRLHDMFNAAGQVAVARAIRIAGLASGSAINDVGTLTLIMCAPSSAAMCAPYATTSSAVSAFPSSWPPRGYAQTTTAKPFALASAAPARTSSNISYCRSEPG